VALPPYCDHNDHIGETVQIAFDVLVDGCCNPVHVPSRRLTALITLRVAYPPDHLRLVSSCGASHRVHTTPLTGLGRYAASRRLLDRSTESTDLNSLQDSESAFDHAK